MQNEINFQRDVKDHWYVKYNENGYPHVQQGWVLPPERKEDFDPFILMADDWFKRGTFSDHPHRGFQTITYVIDGRLEHIDNHGGHSILEAGDVQYMNAGWAARHAEEAVDDDLIHTLQLWLNLPKHLKNTKTSYQNIYVEDVPVIPFDNGSLKVYSGKIAGVTGPMNSLVPITMTEISFNEAGVYTHILPENHNAFLIVRSGEVEIGTSKIKLRKTGVATLTYKEEGSDQDSELVIKANNRAKLLVYSGVPLKEEVVAYGPFVMNTMEEIKQAFRDFHDGKFGPPAK
ncbi:pirin family protein [Lederbergia citri]|uniref:Pirin family protein n=1 Tax=Lederbergia citri TaxID=2833580 RepID=A0A942TG59_9BACI|nr:pirin-like C-terminal cupin domain-containing protein [Lederbergia citri]MBS4197355.1 pirin family protein [Lederbergia citri]